MTYNNELYDRGVHSALVVEWTLSFQTPVVVKNSLAIGYTEKAAVKGRGLHVAFKWIEPSKEDHTVSNLHFDYQVSGGAVSTYHSIPNSSIRGTLRGWCLRTLMDPALLRDMMKAPQREEGVNEEEFDEMVKDYLGVLKQALSHKRHGYQVIASLFGHAAETRDDEESYSNAGRLRVLDGGFRPTHAEPIRINGTLEQGAVGPDNANRQMTVRNPIDRMTHASKSGGLHHFLEYCEGEQYDVRLVIRNPQNVDLGLLSLWTREINDGLLRFGALSNVGRGRVAIADAAYTLWARSKASLSVEKEKFEKSEPTSTDILAGFWEAYTLPSETLPSFEDHLINEIEGEHASS